MTPTARHLHAPSSDPIYFEQNHIPSRSVRSAWPAVPRISATCGGLQKSSIALIDEGPPLYERVDSGSLDQARQCAPQPQQSPNRVMLPRCMPRNNFATKSARTRSAGVSAIPAHLEHERTYSRHRGIDVRDTCLPMASAAVPLA